VKVGFDSDEHEHDLVGVELSRNGVHLISPFGDSGWAEIGKFKLLLRPLSDLTTEQEDELDLLHGFSSMNFYRIKTSQLEYPYTIVQKLLEWHFDVFSLLDSGDALPLTAPPSVTGDEK
jgi:hypothetical protein